MVDAVTLEVVRNALEAVSEEMNAVLVRTAYSPNIKDRRDCSCALFDADAELISQAENIPVHLGAMPFSVREAVGALDLRPGDAALVNDPYRGGAHLPDLTLVSPVYVDGGLVGYAANRAHHSDVGGMRPGSVAADSTEIYQEGLRIPPVKLYRGGDPNRDVMDLLLANVRTPEERRGDLRAQHLANQRGADRLSSLVERYGKERILGVMGEVKDYSERRMRGEIQDLPSGTYGFSDVLDGDGQGATDIEIHVEVTVDGDSVEVDFGGSAGQVGGAVNAVLAVTVSATYYAVRCVTDPGIPPNHGCYRPIEVVAPSGSVVNAEPPAAVVGGNLEASQRVTDVVLGAFAEAAPERVAAAGQGTMNNLTFGGGDEGYAFYETEAGGGGGRRGLDGMDAVHVHMSNTLNTPAEVIETTYPLRVVRYELRRDSGGAGRWRGGLGLRRDIMAVEPASFSLLADRRRNPPYGLLGGEPGAVGEDYLLRDGDEEQIPPKSTHELREGDVVSVRTPGGGGYGDPGERDPSAVARDVRLGKVSVEAAGEDYGVSVEREP